MKKCQSQLKGKQGAEKSVEQPAQRARAAPQQGLSSPVGGDSVAAQEAFLCTAQELVQRSLRNAPVRANLAAFEVAGFQLGQYVGCFHA